MNTDSLIDKLDELQQFCLHGVDMFSVSQVYYIIRQHTAAHGDVVERVVQAIRDTDNGENNMHDIAKAAIAAMGGTPPVEGATTGDKVATIDAPLLPPAQTSEISVVDDEAFIEKVCLQACIDKCARSGMKRCCAQACMACKDELREYLPYLRTTIPAADVRAAGIPKPVSVSFEEMAEKAFLSTSGCGIWALCGERTKSQYRVEVRTVLDATGVKYHE